MMTPYADCSGYSALVFHPLTFLPLYLKTRNNICIEDLQSHCRWIPRPRCHLHPHRHSRGGA